MSEKKVKKTKKGKVKKAKSAYNYFIAENQPKVARQYPNDKFTEVFKKTVKLWKNLSDAEKEPYQKKADADLKRSQSEREKQEKSKPKRKLSGYIKFANSIRSELQAKHPSKKLTEITKLIGLEWNKLSESEKAKWK